MSSLNLTKRQANTYGNRVTGVGQSSKLWLLVIPMLFFASQGHFSFQLGDESVGGALPGAVATRVPSLTGDVLVPALAYSMVLWLMSDRMREVIQLTKRFKMLTVMAMLAILSSCWSQSPLRSLIYGFFFLVGTLFAFWLILSFSIDEIKILLERTGMVACLLGIVLILVFPEYGLAHDVRSSGAWRGIFSNRTGAAKVLVFLVSPALTRPIHRSLSLDNCFLVLVMVMLIKLRAVTSFIVLLAYILTLVFLRFSRAIGRRLSLLAFAVVAGFSILMAGFAYFDLQDLLRALDRDPTLTGRTLIWSALGTSILKHPWLGYGFYAYWQGLIGESASVIHATNWTFGYAHNGYIEILLQIGLIGGIVFFHTLFRALKDAWICLRSDSFGVLDWYVGLIVIIVLYNLDEETIFWPNELTSILYIVVCCGLSIGQEQITRLTFGEVINDEKDCLSLVR